ncbi:MAG: hypothetical protein A2X52_07480 [Candidatus Rokubacteria bacterium GWC2_70_16]|nr:MAG: hypothetical protein A2X52_07480 [Candidatus Rokubacteria bacterium GWC2_70_16]
MKRIVVLLAVLMLAGCGRGETPQQKAAARLARAEVAMEACKQRHGLQTTPTPSTVILDDPTTRGQMLTPAMADQLRMKVQCRMELDELLEARRGAAAGQ